MDAKEVIRHGMQLSHQILTALFADLSDSELFVRTSPSANHQAWQLGHLIASERRMIEAVCPGSSPELPDGFADRHSSTTTRDDDASHFQKKETYLDLYQKQRAATLAALEQMSADDLDQELPGDFRRIGRTVGHLFALQSAHEMWHIGQLTALRRQLDKPVLF